METFEFPEADTIRRQVSVDFTLPQLPAASEHEWIAVPLTILKKGNLRNFDLRDANGVSRSLLTTRQNADLVVAGFEAFLAGVQVSGDSLATYVRGIVGEHDSAVARERLDRALEGELGHALGSIPSGPGAAVLRLLLEELAGGYMLLLPLRHPTEERCLFKFTYDAPLKLPPKRLRDRGYRLITGVSSSFGWSAGIEDFEEIQVGWAESYHVEVAPPADTWVAEAVLEEETGERDEMDRDSSPRLLRPHLRVAGQGREQTAQLTLFLYARRDALVVPLVFAAIAITAVLAYVPEHRSSLDGQTLGALLLVPFALSTLYVRPGEHTYISKGIRGMRLVALIPVVAGVVVLALIGLGSLGREGYSSDAVEGARWAARVSAVATYLLLVAILAPTVANRTRPTRRHLQVWVRGWCAPLRAIPFLALGVAWLAFFASIGCLLYSVFPS